ncbi:MAG: mechanosensitive ion channel domain-containing protein [Pseudomonadota bacterium]
MIEIILAARPAWLPVWAVNLLILACGAFIALAAHDLAVRAVRRATRSRDGFLQALLPKLRRPTRLAALILGVGLAAEAAPMGADSAQALQRVLSFGFVILVGWSLIVAIDIWAVLHARQYKVDSEDNLLARKHLTQLRILTRTASIIVGLVSVGLALMSFPGVRQYGVSLLASAGAAGIIAGLALQPFLTNLVAGLQIATTQPIRIDDAVIVENEWGQVEEITSTYVVVRLWDWRRMILPLTYFMQKPFQNWTRETASLIGTAMIYVDYTAPIERLRAKLEEIARASPLWDGQVVNLAVTDLTERTMQVRCLISGRNAGQTFDLRCEVREKMIAFLQAELPEALPRDRLVLPRDPFRAPGPDADPGPRGGSGRA